MKVKLFAIALVALVGLSGCAAPVVNTTVVAPEPMGNRFTISQQTHVGTNNSILFVVRSENDAGKLKICGLRVYGGDDSGLAQFNRGISDRSSYIEIGTAKGSTGIRVHPDFLASYSAKPNTRFFNIGKDTAPPPSPIDIVNELNLVNLNANCVTTNAEWREGLDPAAAISIRISVTTYVPGHVIYIHHK
jgi:hypothetical protein